MGVGLYLIIILLFLNFIQSSAWRGRKGEILSALWITLAFPLIPIIMGGLYYGLFAVWSVLLVFLLAVATSRFSSRRLYGVAVAIVVIVASLMQYNASLRITRELAANKAPERKFFEDVTNTIMALPPPRRVVFFYDESKGPFQNHLLFNRHILISLPDGIQFTGFMSIHDSYFLGLFGNKSVQERAESVIADIEKHPHTIAVTFCEADSLKAKNWYFYFTLMRHIFKPFS